MTKRMFEVILIVSILFLVIYFLLYHLYFDSLCNKTSGFIGNNQQTTIILMGQCKDKLVCNVNNIKNDKEKVSIVKSWECRKTQFDYFEPSYYKKKLNNLIK